MSGELDVAEQHPLMMARDSTLVEITDGLAFVESFANVTVLVSDDRLVLIDAGGVLHAQQVHTAVRSWTDAPLDTAVYTHGHVDHVFAVPYFEAEQGSVDTTVIAHEQVVDRFDRYNLTNGYNGVINQRQFSLGAPLFPSNFRYPDTTYRDRLDVSVGGLDIELHHDRGETDDHTWAWIPGSRTLCTGDLFIWVSPNCGNPQKVQRYPAEWARALRKMIEKEPELLLPGHGLPIVGADRIAMVLDETAELLESVLAQSLDLMNAGARLDELIHTVSVPDHLRGRPWLQPVYDEPEFIVHNVWRLYGGWYDGNPATLKPASEAALATEIAQLAGGASVLAERARALSDDGNDRLASHFAELAALAAPDDAGIQQARSEVFGARARRERSLMARGVYGFAERESAARADELRGSP